GTWTLQVQPRNTPAADVLVYFAFRARSLYPPVVSLAPFVRTPANLRTYLSSSAIGSGTLRYQWYEGNSAPFLTPIPGATFYYYLTPPLATQHAYTVQVSNDVGSTTASTTVFIENPPCSVTLSPGGGYYSRVGGTSNFNVIADPTCSWSASAQTPGGFLKVPAQSGTGNGLVTFTIDPNIPIQPNATTAPRYATILVNDRLFYLNQLGASPAACPPPFSIQGPGTIQNGQNLALIVNPGKGFTYEWFANPGPPTPISTQQAIFLRPGDPNYPTPDRP